MLVSIRTVTFLILFSSCVLSGQVIQVELPQSADLVLDSILIGENVTSLAFNSDTGNHTLHVIRDGSMVTSKSFQLKPNEKRRYVLEEDGLGGERLFYRSGEITSAVTSINTASPFDFTEVNTEAIQTDVIAQDDSIVESTVPDLIEIVHPDSLNKDVETFEEALVRISEIHLEFDRSQAMIAWAVKNDMTVDQIRKFGELSAFDPSRFMLLQRLYPHCSDAENYGTLRDLFDFKPYKTQFSEWLAKQSELE
ncbi:MAG: DUF4476 domain-containing protein [Flavobacteriia bacterium]|nr:DUF4476 domain-containing protein [Flavobacteriia bacterium]